MQGEFQLIITYNQGVGEGWCLGCHIWEGLWPWGPDCYLGNFWPREAVWRADTMLRLLYLVWKGLQAQFTQDADAHLHTLASTLHANLHTNWCCCVNTPVYCSVSHIMHSHCCEVLRILCEQGLWERGLLTRWHEMAFVVSGVKRPSGKKKNKWTRRLIWRAHVSLFCPGQFLIFNSFLPLLLWNWLIKGYLSVCCNCWIDYCRYSLPCNKLYKS